MKTNKGYDLLLVQIGERLDNFREDVKSDILEIKSMFNQVFDRLNRHSKCITEEKVNLDNHLANHNIGRGWTQWIPSLVAVLIAVFALFK